MAVNPQRIEMGVCDVTFKGNDLGATKGGVEVSIEAKTYEVKSDQTGESPIKEIITGTVVEVKCPFLETDLLRFPDLIPMAELSGQSRAAIIKSGVNIDLVANKSGKLQLKKSNLVIESMRAVGQIVLVRQPANDTFIIVGKDMAKYTFKTTPTAGAQYEVKIGSNATATAINLKSRLAATLPADTYSFFRSGTVVTMYIVNATGNPATPEVLAASSGSNCTVHSLPAKPLSGLYFEAWPTATGVGKTVEFNGVSFSCVADNTTSPTATQWKVGTDLASYLANLAATLNAHGSGGNTGADVSEFFAGLNGITARSKSSTRYPFTIPATGGITANNFGTMANIEVDDTQNVFTAFIAAPVPKLSFKYATDAERVYEVTFKCYPNDNGIIAILGDDSDVT